MKRPQLRGFSIIEMLLVVTIIVVLLLMLVPVLFDQSLRTAYIATCASNEQQIYKASIAFRIERGLDDRITLSERWDPGVWPDIFAPYVADSDEGISTDIPVFVCPEDPSAGPGRAGGPDDWWGQRGTNGPWVDMNEGVFFRKISGVQYKALVDANRDRDGSWGSYFRNEYEGYEPDEKGEFLLGVEDAGWPNTPGGDFDFNDMVARVVPQETGEIHIYGRRWSSMRWSLFFGPDREDLFNMAGQWGFGTWEGPFTLPGGQVSSYGINAETNIDAATSTGKGKVFMMDYTKPDVLADPVSGDDWEQFRFSNAIGAQGAGNLVFARHLNHTSNVVYDDGSVKQVNPEDLNPAFEDIYLTYWQP
jgi:type II secretory pathway pseudopilin PulG